MQEQIIQFKKNPNDMKNLASFIGQLVVDGIAYYIKDYEDNVEVHITGGYQNIRRVADWEL